MTARTGKFLPIGMRYAAVFELDVNGRPKATTVTAYSGLKWEGPLAFDISLPNARVIPHLGADRVLRTATLPTQESPSATLRVSDYRFDIQAILSAVTVGTVGEAKEFPLGTSKAGYEPVVGLLFYQQSQDLDTGALTWHAYIIPKARCILAPASMNGNAGEITYQVVPTPSTQRIWGKTLTLVDDKYVDATIFEYDCQGEPRVVGFIGDGVALDFLFPAGEPALDVAKIEVYKNGVKLTAGITPAVDKVTFTVAPLATDMITVFYEK